MDNENLGKNAFADVRARPSGIAYAMRAEAESVLANSAFRRSPIIAKLLRFLIEETLGGRAHLLKSYTVAVDGLGRPADFDVGDSYARVQMGRLRKMLQSHYAEHGPVDELCIYLQHGSYVVRIAKLATAYPTLFRPLSAAGSSAIHTVEPVATTEFAPKPAKAKKRLQKWHLGVLAGIVAALVFGMLWQSLKQAEMVALSPILELGSVDPGNNEDAAQLARLIEASLDNGLPRFKIARVRLINGQTADSDANEGLAYRLHSQIEQRNGGAYALFLRLTDLRNDTLVWSRKIDMPPEPASIDDAIAPLLSEIVGPHGIVATQSAIAYKDNNDGGYPCLMKFFAYLKTRDATAEKLVAKCFQKPVQEARIRATILASRALFALESRTNQETPKSALAKARAFANQALAADANDGSARFAMARIAYMEGDCMSARFYTQQTVEANPYSPIFMAGLAGHAPQCRYDKSDDLLDRAFLVADASDTDGRLLLVIAAVAQGRADRVAELDTTSMPRNGRHRLNYYLSESIIAASQDRNRDATRYWQLFSNMRGGTEMSPEQLLQPLILSPILRRQVIEYLSSKSVLAMRSAGANVRRIDDNRGLTG